MSSQTATPADPYANLAESYDRLAEWAISQQQESPRDRVADFLQSFWRKQHRPVRTVLEICSPAGSIRATAANVPEMSASDR